MELLFSEPKRTSIAKKAYTWRYNRELDSLARFAFLKGILLSIVTLEVGLVEIISTFFDVQLISLCQQTKIVPIYNKLAIYARDVCLTFLEHNL